MVCAQGRQFYSSSSLSPHLLSHSLSLPRPSNTDTQQQEPPVDIITPYPVDTIPPGGADQQ